MISKVYSICLRGINGFTVGVECSTTQSLPSFELVGLPDAAVKEAKERVRTACDNSGLKFPSCEITVNLAPANLKKEGSHLDLPILLSILCSCGKIRRSVTMDRRCFVGELSLSGDVEAVNGVLAMAASAKAEGFDEIYVPAKNASEAAVIGGIRVYGVGNINELVAHLNGRSGIAVAESSVEYSENTGDSRIDFRDVKGQRNAKRAIEVAAAGGHNILMIGPPGSGKSMLAKCLPGILPDMTFDEAVETTMIHSVAGQNVRGVLKHRPVRSPHHTVSIPGLIGGGANPRPGEVSLANNGVLFLDELPEFGKALVESLRQPVEDGRVTVTRIMGSVTYPASFMLVCAMNPCRCGYYGDPTRNCTCSAESVKRYLSKVSGPMLDRMDIQIELPSVSYEDLNGGTDEECSSDVKQRVDKARQFAKERAKREGVAISDNAHMSPSDIRLMCRTDETAKVMLKNAFEKMGLSARAHDKILRVARTIADLDGCELIGAKHIAEAIQYRSLDRKYWHIG